ncbi:hypothetical protein ANCCAN_21096 [Ancylostoma caninum]|uniref:MULE transposase domain-containing protein n=1 Tax=Ancylostoma caninum TaxID=29170 RepID=A0A368FQI5_ANCCA|nr:hypothetical protein ANCCAN_21096 [Ancylostoma caninum]
MDSTLYAQSMSILYNYAADVPQQFYTEGPSPQTQHIQGNSAGDEFHSDPCEMDHICEATDAANDIGTRSDCTSAGKKRLREWMKLINSKKGVPEDDEELWEDIQHHLHGRRFSQRRKVLSRAINVHKDKTVTMNNVPEIAAQLADGSKFLHEQNGDFHVYYSEETMQRACRNGLHAIIADGMLSLHRKELGRHAHLYCIHGVCAGGVEVPILFAITAKKTAKEYTKIFNHVKDQISNSGREGLCPTRIILDFEKAAIKATKKVFPNSKLGTEEEMNWGCRRTSTATKLTNELGVSGTPSWGWYSYHLGSDGTYKDLSSKWEIEELRTTNLAEAFNRKLGVLFESHYPPLKELIDGLKNTNTATNCSLRYLEEHSEEEKLLRARDRRRREKISELMNNIEIRFNTQGLSAMSVETYCKEMSVYATEKSN